MMNLVIRCGRWKAIWALVFLALRSLPITCTGADASAADAQDSPGGPATKSQPDQKAANGAVPAKDGQPFELLVVGPGAKPISDAVVEIAITPMLTAEQVQKGTFVSRGRYATRVRTDAQGRLAVAIPRAPAYFSVYIKIPGFGPYWAGWSSESHRQTIPPQFTAELEPAWSVGGIIVDGAGKPIEGVTIGPSIEFKKRPGETQQLASGASVKTDRAGRWHFDSVPVSVAEVGVSIAHPKFKPVNRLLSRREFGIDPGREPAMKVVMERGLTVTGKVTDEAGKPIAGALVRTQFYNDTREAETGADGLYTLVGFEPRQARIVVSAEGRGIDVKEVNIQPGMGPVDFQMHKGGTVRVRVVDELGNPVPKVRIFFQRWRGGFADFEFGRVNQYADANGVWVWNEAPRDQFSADICPPNGMTLQEQPLVARAEEYVFRVPGALVVYGKVTDAVTKNPIQRFRVIPGGQTNQGQTFWNNQEGYQVADGHYEYRWTRAEPANRIRVEADGYLPGVSREIRRDEGRISIDFELKRGQDVAGKVVTPRNLPAAGAKIALGEAGSQINLKNGDIDDISTLCARSSTDDSGRFHFPAQDKDFHLVIAHPSGFAHITSTPDWQLTRIIHLEPWSRVEGTFHIGKQPAANMQVELDVDRLVSHPGAAPSFFTQYQSTTTSDGKFVFERVIPGTGRIGRRITFMADQGATEVGSSFMIPAEFPAGKTVHIDLGGTGRAVVGRLQAPKEFPETVHWNFASISVVYDAAVARPEIPDFTATVDRDGMFRIDDMPPGEYSLRVDFIRPHAGRLEKHHFKVPSVEGNSTNEPVDLGVVKLGKR